MKRITINDVRNALANMGNTYVRTLTNEELSSASLQDDLGMEETEIDELIAKLEAAGHFFITKPALQFLETLSSISVRLLRRICNNYVLEFKPCYS